MFLDELSKVVNFEYVDESNLDKIYLLYSNNIDYMQNKEYKTGSDIYESVKLQNVINRKFILVKIDNIYCGMIDFYLDYPNKYNLFINYFMIDKKYHHFEMGKEIMRDFISLALKENDKIILSKKALNPNVIDFWNSLGFSLSKSNDYLSIEKI